MLRLIGKQGKTVLVEGSTVRIIKNGSLFSARREKAYPIRNITSVEVKKPGLFMAGFIQISIGGGHARNSSFSISGGAIGAAQDENSVLFTGRNCYESALTIKQYIESHVDTPPAPPPPPPPRRRIQSSSAPPQVSTADELLKWKKLLDEGVITVEQFEKKKTELLG